jgi:hypothetical protein
MREFNDGWWSFEYGRLESSKVEALALKYIMDFSSCRLDNHRQRFWPSMSSSGWHLMDRIPGTRLPMRIERQWWSFWTGR